MTGIHVKPLFGSASDREKATERQKLAADVALFERRGGKVRVGLSKSTLYSRISVGSFPKPVTLGSSVRWVESEVEAWISERVSERDHGNETGGRLGVRTQLPPRRPLLHKA